MALWKHFRIFFFKSRPSKEISRIEEGMEWDFLKDNFDVAIQSYWGLGFHPEPQFPGPLSGVNNGDIAPWRPLCSWTELSAHEGSLLAVKSGAVHSFVFQIHTSGKDLSGYFIFSRRRMEQESRFVFHSSPWPSSLLTVGQQARFLSVRTKYV